MITGSKKMETIGMAMDRLEAQQAQTIQLPPDGNSLEFLQLVYRNSALPLHTRMRAAMAALKHEVPALLATAIVNEGSFAELLDRRLKRLEEIKTNGGGKLIEAQPIADARLSPSIPDRRFRKI